MKKTAIIFILILLATALGWIYYKKNLKSGFEQQTKIDATGSAATNLKPWVEVLSSKVFEINASGTVLRELETGDEVDAGSIIKTDATGLVNIYFAEGSVARLDSDTELKINEAKYNPEDESLVVKIFLVAGRVWSKILGLTTQDAQWQVDTANSVATVRGTAFGVEYEGGRTSILGSENNVAVRFKHPKTRKILEESVEIIPNSFIEIDDSIIDGIAEKRIMAARILRRIAPSNYLMRQWVRRARTADSELNLILKQEYIEAIDSVRVGTTTATSSQIQNTTIDTSATITISPNLLNLSSSSSPTNNLKTAP
ncbi:MAG: FecR domain-containing protein [Patescibacteria group bacterium]